MWKAYENSDEDYSTIYLVVASSISGNGGKGRGDVSSDFQGADKMAPDIGMPQINALRWPRTKWPHLAARREN